MRVFGLWHGGYNYSHGEMPADGESWPSLADAKRSLVDRWRYGSWIRDSRARVIVTDEDGVSTLGVVSDDLRPRVTDNTHIDLYPAERVGRDRWRIGDEPYARLTLGPRWGVRVENY